MPFVWSVGTVLGPSIGGAFCNPAEHIAIFSDNALFQKFPYLLPNLVCTAILLVGMVIAVVFLEETHVEIVARRGFGEAVQTEFGGLHNSEAQQALLLHLKIDESDPKNSSSYGTFITVTECLDDDESMDETTPCLPSPPSIAPKKAITRSVLMMIIATSIFTYHAMAFDHLFPIFLQDSPNISTSTLPSFFRIPGGFGLTTRDVGLIMSIDGFIALLIQAMIFPWLATTFGVWRLFLCVTLLHPIAYFLVPYAYFLPEALLYPGIYACLTLKNFFAILQYPLLLILIKDAAPSKCVLGKINGLAASAAAACRTVSPPMSGYLYGVGQRVEFVGLAWWISGVVALVGSVQCLMIERPKSGEEMDGSKGRQRGSSVIVVTAA